MNELNVNIVNGYGIKKFSHKFIFDKSNEYVHNNTHVIYAQNGTMKSSFAKVLKDYSAGNKIRDRIFELDGSCVLKDDNGDEIEKDKVFSIASFDNGEFESNSTATLLVSAELREKYAVLTKQFDDASEDLFRRIKKVSRINQRYDQAEIIGEISKQYGDQFDNSIQSFITLVKSIRSDIEKAPEYIQEMSYMVVGSTDTLKFADENKGVIQELMDAWEEVKRSASYLRGEFDTGNATKLVDAIKKTQFLEVDHQLGLLNSQSGDIENISNLKDLEAALETDVDKILASKPALKKKFTKMVKDLSADKRYDLKKTLENEKTKNVILLMNNPKLYLRSLWEGYLKGCLEEFDELCRVQGEIKKPLEEIIEAAKNERTEWDIVVKKFNDKFRNLPYEIGITNRESVILEGVEEPEPFIKYKDGQRTKSYVSVSERNEIKNLLSTGERKALYLLNVIFEIEASQKNGKPCLVVLDDIVDSFDYKNKYAFLEYIHDISQNLDQIRLIIFTHNFDFFRLLQSRLFGNANRTKLWFATKGLTETTLEQAGHFRVFAHMREKAVKDKHMWLAAIPFARNLAEYRCADPQSDPDYQLLTKCLHNLGEQITVREIKLSLSNQLGINESPYQDDEVFEKILLSAADEITRKGEKAINIYDNLLLSIGARRSAENYMISKMKPTDVDEVRAEASVFTRSLFTKYRDEYSEVEDTLDFLELVNLITPEHIHLNSFMYEPLIDMSSEELQILYGNIKNLK